MDDQSARDLVVELESENPKLPEDEIAQKAVAQLGVSGIRELALFGAYEIARHSRNTRRRNTERSARAGRAKAVVKKPPHLDSIDEKYEQLVKEPARAFHWNGNGAIQLQKSEVGVLRKMMVRRGDLDRFLETGMAKLPDDAGKCKFSKDWNDPREHERFKQELIAREVEACIRREMDRTTLDLSEKFLASEFKLGDKTVGTWADASDEQLAQREDIFMRNIAGNIESVAIVRLARQMLRDSGVRCLREIASRTGVVR